MGHACVRRRLLVGLCVAGLGMGGGGCSSFQPKKQPVSIDTLPTGATLTIDGKTKGHTPLTLLLSRNKDHVVVATLDGRSVVRNLRPKLSRTGVLDLVGTFVFLFPGIGLFSPGAYDLDTTQMVLELPPDNSEKSVPATTQTLASPAP